MRRHFLSYRLLVSLICIGLISVPVFLNSTQFVNNASARPWEYEINITVPAKNLETFDLLFYQGVELEFTYTMSVNQNLPVDIWFVNDDNYALLLGGGQFLYYIDGSASNLTKATKIVILTLYDTYKLVFMNYNDEAVNVILKYDINVPDFTPPSPPSQVAIKSKGENEITMQWQANTEPDLEGYIIQRSTSSDGPFTNMTTLEKNAVSYTDYGLDSGKKYYYQIIAIDSSENPSEPSTVISATTEETPETPFWQSAIFLVPIALIGGLIVGLIISYIYQKSGRKEQEAVKKPSKKGKKHKPKKKKAKAKQKKPSEKPKTVEAKEEKEIPEKPISPTFCGYCGKPVETPFCVFCGKAVEAPKATPKEGASET